jgi:hypothetical protein
MSQVSVSIFNANTMQVTVIVNNGSPLIIGPTSSASEFRPEVPAVAPVFVTGPATPGTIGIGPNCIAITPSGWTTPQFFPFTIPEVMPISSLQIYIYWNDDTGTCQAYFASSGQFFYQCSGQKQAPLVPINAWPGVQFQYRFEAGSNDAASLVIDGCFDPDSIAPSDSPASEKVAVSVRQEWSAIAQRYSVIVDQLSDPNILVMVSTTLAGGVLPGSDSIAASLLVFAQTILAEVFAAASSSSSTSPQPQTFAASAAVAFSAVAALTADIVPVGVTVTLARTKPALIDPTAPANMSPVALIASSVSAQFAPGGSPPQSPGAAVPLSAFAIKFENAFTNYDGSGGVLKLAQRAGVPSGNDPGQIATRWVVRWSATAGIGVSFTDKLVYFGLKPLSKTLLSGQSGDYVFSGADLDLLGRQFATAFDAFFAPEMAAAIAILDVRHGTIDYDTIAEAKTNLAKTIPRGLGNVFASQQGMGSLSDAQNRLTQALLTALANAFDVTTIVQAPGTVKAAGAAPPGVTEPPMLSGAVGPITRGSPGPASRTQYALTPGELCIVSGKSSPWLTSLLTVAQPGEREALYLPLTYDITHLRHAFTDSDPVAAGACTASSWLKFLRPGKSPLRIPIADQAGIPIPLIAAPAPPVLNSQSGTASPLPSLASPSIKREMDAALRWDYALDLTPNWSAQDDLLFKVAYNVGLAASKLQAGSPEETRMVLLQALTDFLSWYHENQAQFPAIVKEASLPTELATTRSPTADTSPPDDSAGLVAAFAAKSAAVASAWAALYEPMMAFAKPDAKGQVVDSFQILRGSLSPQTVSLYAVSNIPNASNPAYWPTVTVYSGDESQSWMPDNSQAKSAGSPNEGWWVLSHTFSVPSFDRLVFTFAKIDLQQRQNAVVSAHVRRNAELVGNEPTHPDFVRESEIVTFPASVIPLIHRAPLPTVPPDETGLQQTLIDIFTPLAKPAAQWKPTFRVSAAYSWQLAVPQNEGPVLPVSEAILLADGLDFQATPIGEIAGGLAQEIARWYVTNAPSHEEALLNLAVTVCAVVAGDHLPLIELDQIPIDVSGVSDAWWSQTVSSTLV